MKLFDNLILPDEIKKYSLSKDKIMPIASSLLNKPKLVLRLFTTIQKKGRNKTEE